MRNYYPIIYPTGNVHRAPLRYMCSPFRATLLRYSRDTATLKGTTALRRYLDNGDNDRLHIGSFVLTVFATYTNYRAFRAAYTAK